MQLEALLHTMYDIHSGHHMGIEIIFCFQLQSNLVYGGVEKWPLYFFLCANSVVAPAWACLSDSVNQQAIYL